MQSSGYGLYALPACRCIEVIDAIESWELNFSRGNAVKYIARAGHKNDELEDLKKAAWYINREIERLEKLRAP